MFAHYGKPDFKHIDATMFNINKSYDGFYELPKCFYLAPVIEIENIKIDGKYTTKWVNYLDYLYKDEDEEQRCLFKFEVDLSKVLIINSVEDYLHYLDLYGTTYEDEYGLYKSNYYRVLSKIDKLNIDHQYKILLESGKISLLQELEAKFKSVKRLDPVKIKEAGFNGYYLTENIYKESDVKKDYDDVYNKITQYQDKLLNKLEEVDVDSLDDYCQQLTLYVSLNVINYCKFEQLLIWDNDDSFIKYIN